MREIKYDEDILVVISRHKIWHQSYPLYVDTSLSEIRGFWGFFYSLNVVNNRNPEAKRGLCYGFYSTNERRGWMSVLIHFVMCILHAPNIGRCLIRW